MFTGIVECTAQISGASDHSGNRRLRVNVTQQAGRQPWSDVGLGDSVAVDGTCLTVVELGSRPDGAELAFDVVPETLTKTTLGGLHVGDCVNLERSLSVGDLFGGHYVTGHVDGVGEVRAKRPEGGQVLFEINAPPPLIEQMLVKGSIAVDGISLTLVDVDRSGSWFSFAAIPHTLAVTSLGRRCPGSHVNLEVDAFGKWAMQTLGRIVRDGSRDEQLRRLLSAAGWGHETRADNL